MHILYFLLIFQIKTHYLSLAIKNITIISAPRQFVTNPCIYFLFLKASGIINSYPLGGHGPRL